MSRRKQSLKCRAELYAAKRFASRIDTVLTADMCRWAAGKAWRDGYLAARRDQRTMRGRKRK